jgi:hypothetical protein
MYDPGMPGMNNSMNSVCKVSLTEADCMSMHGMRYVRLDSQAESSVIGEYSLPPGVRRIYGVDSLLEGPDGRPLKTAGRCELYVTPFGWIVPSILKGSKCQLLIGQDVLSKDPHCKVGQSELEWMGEKYPMTPYAKLMWDPEYVSSVCHITVDGPSEELRDPYQDVTEELKEMLNQHVLSGHMTHSPHCVSCMLTQSRPRRLKARSPEYWEEVLSDPVGSHWAMDIFTQNRKSPYLNSKWHYCIAVDKLSRLCRTVVVERPHPTAQLSKADLQALLLEHIAIFPQCKSLELDQQLTLWPSLGEVRLIPRGSDQHVVLAENRVRRFKTLWSRIVGLPSDEAAELLVADNPAGFCQYVCRVMNCTPSQALKGQCPAEVYDDSDLYVTWMKAEMLPRIQKRFKMFPESPKVSEDVFFWDARLAKWATGRVTYVDEIDHLVHLISHGGKNVRKVSKRDIVRSYLFDYLLGMDPVEGLDDLPSEEPEPDPALLIGSVRGVSGGSEFAQQLFKCCKVLPEELSPGSPISPVALLEWFMAGGPELRAQYHKEFEGEVGAIMEKVAEEDKPVGGGRLIPMRYVMSFRQDGTIKIRLVVCQVRPKGERAAAGDYALPLHYMVFRLVLALRSVDNVAYIYLTLLRHICSLMN